MKVDHQHEIPPLEQTKKKKRLQFSSYVITVMQTIINYREKLYLWSYSVFQAFLFCNSYC